MIKDSAKNMFDVIIVWKLDRFARNRYDSTHYKAQLCKNGVKVISANENISKGSDGIILESVLEGMAEYYSADLSEKVILPMIVLKCFDDILSPTLPKKPLLKRLKNFKHKV